MRTNNVIAGFSAVWLGTAAEINGLLYAQGATMRSLDGWGGVALLVLGIIALLTSRNSRPP